MSRTPPVARGAPNTVAGPAVVIVGIGSPNGDDRAGWIAIDRLRPRLPADVRSLKLATPLELTELLVTPGLTGGGAAVFVLDAACPAGSPGRVRHFRWPCAELIDANAPTTHGLGLPEALRLAGTLGRLPDDVLVYTVEAQEVAAGTAAVSPYVLHGIDELADAVARAASGYVLAPAPAPAPAPDGFQLCRMRM